MLPVFFSSNTIPVLLLLSPLTGEGPYHYDWVNIFSSAISPQGFLQHLAAEPLDVLACRMRAHANMARALQA